ncbi:MAG: YceI family protein [Pedobacter sp.]|nr:MAG: YceI family protein [Pedobacter sp.]
MDMQNLQFLHFFLQGLFECSSLVDIGLQHQVLLISIQSTMLFHKIILSIVVGTMFSCTSAKAQVSNFKLDLKQSKIFWKGTKNVGRSHFGFIMFSSGGLTTNASGKLDRGIFVIDMNSVKSTEHKQEKENSKIEKELKSPSFFETAKYPVAHIEVKSIMPSVKLSQFKIEGMLRIKNISHPIVFLATIKQTGAIIHANAELTITREKWGIHHEKPTSASDQFFAGIKNKLVGDEIPIRLSLVFVKK